MGRLLRGNKASTSGRNIARKPMSEETKRKISKSNKGIPKGPLTIETRRKLSESRTGKKSSDATKRKLSLINSIEVSIDDVIYVSMKVAAITLGISQSTVTRRIKSEKYPRWFKT